VSAWPQGEKIISGSQEMAVIIGQWQYFNNNYGEFGLVTNLPKLPLLKFLLLTYTVPTQPFFLATTFDFTSFFTLAFWGRTLSSQLGCFCHLHI